MAGVRVSKGAGVVVITGANRGLGLALAQAYASAGTTVIAGCRRPAGATALAASGAEVHALDTGDASSIQAFAAAVGARPVAVLVNNAGIDARALGAADAARDAMQLDGDVFLDVVRVNTVGPMLLTRALAPNLAAGAGKVVNISSQVGSIEVARTLGRDVSYVASKAALNMVTVKFAQLLKADGVTVVSMHPGWLRTDMGGSGADLDPADAAARIVDTIDALDLSRSPAFVRWDGSDHPW
jgi:NAD(P)-dependent dehydrogenase (short-subunit alcohol dehydrogenase family)